VRVHIIGIGNLIIWHAWYAALCCG
jgi:hypothetical protein